MSAKVHDPITPGEILLAEFLEPLGISQYRLAQATGLPQTRISEIVHGRRRITPDTGLRLSRALGLSERYWINMQTDYDIEAEHDLHEEDLRQVEVLVPRAS
jgi:addiction module HigA family antidote